MPEGHKLHRLARDQSKPLAGQRVEVLSPQGRFADEAAELTGHRIDRIEANGKHLFYHFDADANLPRPIWHVHLGLYGKYRPFTTEPERRGQIRAAVLTPSYGFHLVGPNCCELLDADGYAAIAERLGPDPLRRDADPQRFLDRVARSKAPIGTLLLDQSVIAGVGNIYRADVLHREGIDPQRRGCDLSEDEAQRLWDRTTEYLRLGVKYNRIITADRDTVGKPYGRMKADERLLIYKKDACPGCGGPTEQLTLANRRIDWCPACQV